MVIFEDDSLLVKKSLHSSHTDIIFITFTYRMRPPAKAEEGFGESFFNKRKVSAIHFIAKQNHWWQAEGVLTALKRVAEHLADFKGLVCAYGFSMGGYGALLCAAHVRTDVVLAFAPQVSVDMAETGDKRWAAEMAALRPLYERFFHAIPDSTKTFVFYDPFAGHDQVHVDMLRAYVDIESICLPFGGHGILGFLRQVGLFPSQIDRFIQTRTLDASAIRAGFRENRRQSPIYYRNIADFLRQRNRHLELATVCSLRSKKLARQLAAKT